MGKRIPVSDDAPTVAFEDAVQVVFDALGEVPEFRDPRGRRIELHGTLAVSGIRKIPIHITAPAVEAGGKADGVIALTATIGKAAHRDRFASRVFGDDKPGRGRIAEWSRRSSFPRRFTCSAAGHW